MGVIHSFLLKCNILVNVLIMVALSYSLIMA